MFLVIAAIVIGCLFGRDRQLRRSMASRCCPIQHSQQEAGSVPSTADAGTASQSHELAMTPLAGGEEGAMALTGDEERAQAGVMYEEVDFDVGGVEAAGGSLIVE